MLNVKKILVAASVFAATLASANTTVLTFDDLQTNGGVVQMPQHYGGLTWDFSSNWSIGWQVWDTAQYSYPAASGDNVAFAHSNEIGVSFANASVFNGAFFGGHTTASFDLYLNNQLVASSPVGSMGTSGNAAQWIGSGYSGLVDRVHVKTYGGRSDWVMDNFTFTTAVPEPETYAMLLAGMGLIGSIVKRRKQNAV